MTGVQTCALPISHKALLSSLSAGVCFYTGVVIGVAGRTLSMRVLLAVAAVRKVDI